MDRLAQSAIESEVGARISAKYWQHVTWDWTYSQVILWTGMNKHKYLKDDSGERQIRDCYDFVAAEAEREKARRVGYQVEDLHFYSVPHLKELVAQVVAGVNSTWLDPAYADVQNGIFKLISETSKGIILGYHLDDDDDDGGYDHAIAELQTKLGGQRPKGLK